MEVKSVSGACYLLVFVDDCSRKVFVYFLKKKNEVAARFKEFKALVEKQTGKSIKTLRTDNGGEYVNAELTSFLVEHGIRHELTVPHNSPQNGRAERVIRSVVTMSRCLMQDSGVPKELWAEACNTAAYIKNRSSHAALKGLTPEERWSGRKPNLNHLRVFGCRAFVFVPKVNRKRWDATSTELVMIGYSETTKGYRLLDPQTMNVKLARDVVFVEDQMFFKQGSHERNDDETPHVELPCNKWEASVEPPRNDAIQVEVALPGNAVPEVDVADRQNLGEVVVAENLQNVVAPELLEIVAPIPNDRINPVPAAPVERRYPLRERRATQFPDFVLYHTVGTENLGDPVTVNDALSRHDKDFWFAAMTEEYASLMKNQAWELVEKPTGVNIVSCKWVFKLKRGVGGEERYKARLVARGFTQREGFDYDDTFAPVVRRDTFRLLIALAVKLNLEFDHLDVKTAFLNGDLQETVYMRQPAHFVKRGEEAKVCRLKKCIYGLKQASRQWNKKIHGVLISLGFKQSEHEPCVYLRIDDGKIVIVALYVDDHFVLSNDKAASLALKQELMRHFEMEDLGSAKLCLGINVSRDTDTGSISLDQKHYIDELVCKFGLSDAKTVKTPMLPNLDLQHGNPGNLPDVPYQQLLGSLMYIAVSTRPDICYSVGKLCQFNNSFTADHFEQAKRILRYLKGTADQCLLFSSRGDDMFGLVDADWGGCKVDRRSYSGFVFNLCGAAVSWGSKKQDCVALSSTEAEYIALSEAGKEAVHLRGLLGELLGCERSISIGCDNQGAMKLAHNPLFHKRTKHIDVRYHFIRSIIEEGKIDLFYVPTENMTADVLTKALCYPKHSKFREGMGLKSHVKN